MLRLPRKMNGPIWVQPRWPAKFVFITEPAYSQLVSASHELSMHSITLVLTRGYEHENAITRCARGIARRVGALLFTIAYPSRSVESDDIFSPNGHDDLHANAIDVSVCVDSHVLELLPFGVFTSLRRVEASRTNFASALSRVEPALIRAGFSIHTNKIEALQIHCALCDSKS